MKTLLYLSAFLCTLNTTAQESVERWQEIHPDVLFFEQSVYDALSNEQQARLGDHIILYTETITLKDIQQYELNTNLAVKSTTIGIEELNSDEIKHWIGTHQDVKIITQSYFTSLTPADQLIYKQNGALVLEGELITLNDIKNYAAIY